MGCAVLYLRDGAPLLAVVHEVPPVAVASRLDSASDAVAVDPDRQGELEYLDKKLAVTRANLDALQTQTEQLEAASPLVAGQITELQKELSETSRRISELERR